MQTARAVAVADRAKAAAAVLGWEPECFKPNVLKGGHGPGNVLTIVVESEHVTEVFTGFGRKGVRAETLATKAAEEARDYLAAGVPVGEHLADQLLLPIALAGRGAFRTVRIICGQGRVSTRKPPVPGATGLPWRSTTFAS